MRLSLAGFIFTGLAATSAFAQQVISAHSGVIHLVEGKAYLNDKVVETKFGQFPDIKLGQEFRTEEGRAEILLTPGVFMRMGENSSVKMVSNLLADTRVEMLAGSAMIEADEISNGNSIELLYKGNRMTLVKHGLYRLDTEPARLRVYDGEVTVKGDSGQLTLKAGKETSLSGVLMAASFDKKAVDELYTWSSRRAGYLSAANASSAMTIHNSGGSYGNGYYSSGLSGFGGWQFNPLFGMFTYVPLDGFGYSPFGFGWWSPATIVYYAPPTVGGIIGRSGTPLAPNRGGSFSSPFAGLPNNNSNAANAGSAPAMHGGAVGGGSSAGFAGGGGHVSAGGHR
jgi:hypothetical protein